MRLLKCPIKANILRQILPKSPESGQKADWYKHLLKMPPEDIIENVIQPKNVGRLCWWRYRDRSNSFRQVSNPNCRSYSGLAKRTNRTPRHAIEKAKRSIEQIWGTKKKIKISNTSQLYGAIIKVSNTQVDEHKIGVTLVF
jgi:hypothetical protein